MIFSSLTDRLTGPSRRLLIASTFVATMGLTHADSVASDASLAAQNKTIVREAFEKWRAGNNVFAELFDPNIVWTIPGSDPAAGTYRGVKDLAERASAPVLSRLATPIVPQVHNIWAEGDTVIVRFDGSATTTSGAPYINQFIWIFKMEDGSVVEAEGFLDLAAYRKVVENNEPRTQSAALPQQ